MPTPGEHKTVQARILAYAQEIGWRFVPRAEAERRRGFDPTGATPEDRARTASLYFGDLLHERVLAFNPKYKEAEGALIGEFQRLNADIAGNRDFLAYLRNQGKFFCAEENRELDLVLIDYANPDRNVYEVTEEFYVHNGRHGTREDVVFLINGIPVLVKECKNASKDEAIALAVDQLRRYHAETPEVMVPEMIFSATEAIGFAYGGTVQGSGQSGRSRHRCPSVPRRRRALSLLRRSGRRVQNQSPAEMKSPPSIMTASQTQNAG